MAHRALTAQQQGCLKAIRRHPPACGRHALLKPHSSSQSLETSSRRSAPAAVASETAACAAEEAAGAAAWGEKASIRTPSSPKWLSNLPEDVQYDFIICQIWVLKRRLIYLGDAPSGTKYLPRDTEKRFNDEFDKEHQKLWRTVRPWQALDDRLRDQAFDDLIRDTAAVCLGRGDVRATVADQLTAIPEKLSELRAQLDGLPERNIWNGTVLALRRQMSGAQLHFNHGDTSDSDDIVEPVKTEPIPPSRPAASTPANGAAAVGEQEAAAPREVPRQGLREAQAAKLARQAAARRESGTSGRRIAALALAEQRRATQTSPRPSTPAAQTAPPPSTPANGAAAAPWQGLREAQAAKLARQAAARRESGTSGRHLAAKALAEQQRGRQAVIARQRQTEQAVDEGVQRTGAAVDQAAKGVVNAASNGAGQAADNLQEGTDKLQRNLDQAADQAASRAESLVDRVSQGAQSAADSMADLIENFKKTAGTDRPAPYAFQPLTALTADQTSLDIEEYRQYQKLRLLQSVAGLDRGFAANSTAAALVESAALELTGTGEAVTLSWTPVDDKPATMQLLGGTWRLIYSSGFSTGSIGGSQPGPPAGLLQAVSPAGLLPFTLGQVYQVISPYTNNLDNVVELHSKIVAPTLPGFPESKRAVLTASLKHSFEAVGGSTVQITFEDTEVRATGGPLDALGSLPEFMIPELPEPLRPSRQARTSTFDVLYLDDDVRITRGSRGELRIFVRT